MILDWQDALRVAIQTLTPLQREIVTTLLSLPGKRRLTYKHARETWGLDRKEFSRERENAFESIRLHLKGLGLTSSSDLGFG